MLSVGAHAAGRTRRSISILLSKRQKQQKQQKRLVELQFLLELKPVRLSPAILSWVA